MHAPVPKQRARCRDRLEVEAHVEVLGREHRRGRSAGRPCLQRAAVEHAAGVLLEQDAERRPERQLVVAGPLHLARDREHLRAGCLLCPLALEPVRPALDDVRHVAERLDVVDHGRRLVQTLHGRERRAQPWLAAEALERGQQCRLLAADVRARAAVQHDVEVVVGAQDARARVPGGVELGDRALDDRAGPQELTAAVHEHGVASDRVRRDHRALQHLVRLALHQLAVVARAGLRLVEVHGDVRGLAGVLRDERPLHARREPGAAASAQPGVLHHLRSRRRAPSAAPGAGRRSRPSPRSRRAIARCRRPSSP